MKCSKCLRQTKTEAFATFRTRSGEVRRRGICKECRGKYALENFSRLQVWRKNYNIKNRSYKRERDQRRRMYLKTMIDQIKAETPCADCGIKFPPVAMDFDHCKGLGKNKNVSGFVSGAYNLNLVLREIEMCEVVCACCHRIRTAARKENHAPRKTLARESNLKVSK